MTNERMKVLELLAEGKITATDADRLLEKLQESPDETAAPPEKESKRTGWRKYLRIEVDGPEREKVNMRVPLGLLRAGLKLGTVIPERVRERLAEKGIDTAFICASNAEELSQFLENLDVDIDDGDRGSVRIYSE